MEDEIKNEETAEEETVEEKKEETAEDVQAEATEYEKPLDKMTVKDLREVAKVIPGVTGVTAMKKNDLLSLIRESRGIGDEEPVKEKPVMPEPVPDKPVDEPLDKKSVEKKISATQPIIKEPGIKEPVIKEPEVKEPVATAPVEIKSEPEKQSKPQEPVIEKKAAPPVKTRPVPKAPTEEEKKVAEKWPVWEKEESEFPWEYSDKETCLIIEGDVTVTNEEGEEFNFSSGDYVVFPKGMKCKWKIKKDVRKHYQFG